MTTKNFLRGSLLAGGLLTVAAVASPPVFFESCDAINDKFADPVARVANCVATTKIGKSATEAKVPADVRDQCKMSTVAPAFCATTNTDTVAQLVEAKRVKACADLAFDACEDNKNDDVKAFIPTAVASTGTVTSGSVTAFVCVKGGDSNCWNAQVGDAGKKCQSSDVNGKRVADALAPICTTMISEGKGTSPTNVVELVRTAKKCSDLRKGSGPSLCADATGDNQQCQAPAASLELANYLCGWKNRLVANPAATPGKFKIEYAAAVTGCGGNDDYPIGRLLDFLGGFGDGTYKFAPTAKAETGIPIAFGTGATAACVPK